MKKLIICLISLFFLISCASTQHRKFMEYLNQQVGKMTYDEALIKWGEPSSVTEGDKIIIATWRHSKESMIHMPKGQFNPAYSVPVSSGEELQLIFDKSTKLLTGGHYKRW